MKKLIAAFVCLPLSLACVQADTALPPGHPAGVKDAQAADNLFYIYGGVLLYGALLFAITGKSGDAPITTGTAG